MLDTVSQFPSPCGTQIGRQKSGLNAARSGFGECGHVLKARQDKSA
jgi:hypothetical protein